MQLKCSFYDYTCIYYYSCILAVATPAYEVASTVPIGEKVRGGPGNPGKPIKTY